MKMLLVNPRDCHPRTGVNRVRTLTLPSVAAAFQPFGAVRVVDEAVQALPDERFDLVGVSCDTTHAPRAYEIGDRYRRLGVPVVLGGTHPTAVPDEALAHADAVVVGEVEGVAEAVVRDLDAGRLGGVYRSAEKPDLTTLPVPPVDVLPTYRGPFRPYPIELTRGCRHGCRFCFNRTIHGPGFRRRDLDALVAVVRTRPERYLLCMDDNLMNDPDHLGAFAEKVAPLGRTWGGQSTLQVGDDSALLKHLKRSGFAFTFVGLESFSPRSLAGEHKRFNDVARYAEQFDRLRSHGVIPFAGVILGLDGDGPEVFAETAAALARIRPAACAFTMPVAYPGTAFHREMEAAGRILHRDLARYDGHHVVLRPLRMSPDTLARGYHRLARSFYGLRAGLGRFGLYGLRRQNLPRLEALASYVAFTLGYARFHRQLAAGA